MDGDKNLMCGLVTDLSPKIEKHSFILLLFLYIF